MSTFKGFTTVELQAPKKSMFDLTHDKRLSTRMGRLTPILVQEAIPGDKFRGNSEMLVRLAPLNAPIYDQIQVFAHFFFVPNRLLWEDWEEFITGGRLGVGVDPVTAPVPPWFDIGDALGTAIFGGSSMLSDYMGLPNLQDSLDDFSGVRLDILPFAAYYLCWYEYYRDRNYTDDNDYLPLPSGEVPVALGGIWENIMTTKTRDYLKDYFTSALPFTQRGEEVLMPLAGTGSVTYLGQSLVKKGDGTNEAGDRYLANLAADAGKLSFTDDNFTDLGNARIENIDEVLLTASSVSINDFRSAYALQVWLERNAIGGSRYTESIQAHFAVRPQDSRLQRPEYIGGGRLPIKISEVVTSAFSSDGSGVVPAGNLQGHGVGYADMNSFSYFCPEHGFIIGIMSIMNPPSYQQGVPKMFYARRSFLSYPWPTFAKLGEQQVDKVEIYGIEKDNWVADSEGNLPLFGYQSRYADWKYVPNTNHGQFRDTLLFWTLTRTFEDTPVLGNSFVNFSDETQDRIFIVNQDQDNFWIYCHNKLSVVRALPYFGTPNTLNF